MPEPVLIAIAAALASKSAGSLYDLVKTKFTGRHSAEAALTAAEGAAPDSAQVQSLSNELHRAASTDPEFAAQLHATWQATVEQHADQGGVANQISGTVTGKWCRHATSTETSPSDIHNGQTAGATDGVGMAVHIREGTTSRMTPHIARGDQVGAAPAHADVDGACAVRDHRHASVSGAAQRWCARRG